MVKVFESHQFRSLGSHTSSMMDLNKLKNRMRILQCLHGLFIAVLICTGFLGVGLFGYIIVQPVRTCPVIYVMYTTFWLAISLSVFQTLLGLSFLIWFVITLCKSAKTPTTQTRLSSTHTITSRMMAEAVGPSHTDTNGTILANQVHQVYAASPLSFSSRRSESHCTCHPKIGWLCLAGIFLALLSAGLILNLIIVINYMKYLNNSFLEEFTNVFVEAQVNFNTQPSVKRNNPLMCWNTVQSYYECCGSTNYTEWFSSEWNSTNNPSPIRPRLPESCYCRNDCDKHKVQPIDGGAHFVYAEGCNPIIHEVLHFKLHLSQLYFSLTLGLLVVTFLLDLIYTFFIAYQTLFMDRNVSQMHGIYGIPNACSPVLEIPPRTDFTTQG